MSQKYIVALDQGTTSARAIVFNSEGTALHIAQQEFTQHFPQAGWVEHDATEILHVQLHVLKQATAQIDPKEIAAIGITNQRETTVVWDKQTGEPIGRAIVWQCRRTSELCESLKQHGWEQKIKEKTGLVIDPYFSGTKLKWILDSEPHLRERAARGEVLFGTIDTWLIWNLTGGKVHVTDVSNASRTMLYNIHRLAWDDELLQLFDIPKAMLPEVRPSSEIYGYTDVLSGGYGNVKIPIASACGDQQSALFGQACFKPGMAKNTYGTGCFLLANTGETPVQSQSGLLTTIAWGLDGKVEYALEGSVFTAGAVVQWLRDGLGLIEHASETEALAQSVSDTGGVVFVPAFTGLGTPYWNPEARGLISGLSRGTSREHIVRAALESIAQQSREVLDVMIQESDFALEELRVDGAGAQNRFLMQFQADLLNVQVTRAAVKETTALGAAYLAGLAVGFWESRVQISQLWAADEKFEPRMDDRFRTEKIKEWQRAIDKTNN